MHNPKALLGATILALGGTLQAAAPGAEAGDQPDINKLWEIVQQQQQQIEAQKQQIQALLEQQQQTGEQLEQTSARTRELSDAVQVTDERTEAIATAVEQQDLGTDWTDRLTIGGYGSFRGEVSDLNEENNTFTFRRFVLTADARPTDRLQTYAEIEFERFAEIELEKELEAGANEFEAKQVVEGTSSSELAIEQMWARYRFTDSVNLDMGALLVPLGRFNLNHDDNQWNLTRRSLIDKGVPVLPAGAAWPELGVGFSGIVPLGDGGSLLDYRLYVMNGVQLDLELEEEVESEIEDGEIEVKSKLEAEFEPTQGTFDKDLNDNKAIAGRVALRPSPAHEVGVSGYFGRYTPGFLSDEDVWSIGLDGFHKVGPMEIEYQVIHTDWGDIREVAASLADTAISKEIDGGNGEIALGGNSLAKSRTGYWVELRLPFWSSVLNNTFLGRDFGSASIEPTFRFEQVFFNDQITGLEFANRAVTDIDVLEDATLNRATLGIAYRPTPQWVYTIAGEYTWTRDPSLDGLTNFIAAGPGEDEAFAFTVGVAFGF